MQFWEEIEQLWQLGEHDSHDPWERKKPDSQVEQGLSHDLQLGRQLSAQMPFSNSFPLLQLVHKVNEENPKQFSLHCLQIPCSMK